MIGYLKGTVVHSDLKSVILDVSGVGYKIYTNTALLESSVSTPQTFWTYLAVRENSLDLYGFSSPEELSFFELLISVSGIGPKSALGILSIATLENLRRAIVTGDTSHLTKVSGIGKKNAEKIVLELKDKIDSIGDTLVPQSADVDVIEALKSLGYSDKDAREALKKSEGTTPSDRIKSALKSLNS